MSQEYVRNTKNIIFMGVGSAEEFSVTDEVILCS